MNFSFRRGASALVGCAFLVISFAGRTEAAPTARLFPTANGIVKYRMTMKGAMPNNAINNSVITMTWINNGARFRQDMTMNVSAGAGAGAGKMTMKSWSIFDGKSFYTAMPSGVPGQPAGRKIAMKMTLPPNYLKQILSGNASTMPGMKGVSSRVVGRGVVLGKMCEIRAMNIKNVQMNGQVKMWMWNKLPLRTDTNMTYSMRDPKGKKQPQKMTMTMSMVATQLNTNVNPSPSLFRVPAGYKIQDMSAMQKQMMQRMKQR